MILGYLLLMVAAALIFALLIPPIKVEDARAGEFEEDAFPKATENAPITYLIGKDQIKSPNTLFAGGFRIEPQRKRVKTGIFSSKTVTTHYKYFLTMDLGICVGGEDGVTLHEIRIDDEVVWSGEVNNPSTPIYLNASDLFGGDKEGGGFTGTVRFYPGTYTQPKDAYIDAMPESQGLLTRYKGISHAVFEDCYIGESPQLRVIAFTVSRFTNTLALGPSSVVGATTVNVAEAAYAVMTDKWAGLGVDPALIDADNFRDVAATYFEEGNGAAGGVYRDTEGSAFLQELMRQVDTIMTVNPVTNKIILKPLRKDYDVANLLTFDEDHISSVEAYSQTLWGELVSQVKVGFKNENNSYADTTAIDQDLAVANITGQLKTVVMTMPFVKKPGLANKIAGRELNQLSKPATSATLTLNRNAYSIPIGGVFIWRWPDYGIEQMVMRVKKVRGGDDNDPSIRLEVIKDPYGDIYTTFGEPTSYAEPSLIDPPSIISNFLYLDSPKFLVDAAGILPSAAPNLSHLMLLPISWSMSDQEVSAIIEDDQDAYVDKPLPPTGTLLMDIALEDGFSTGTLASLTISTAEMPNTFDSMASVGDLRNGQNLFMIGSELFNFEGYTRIGNVYTLTNVHRALLNTTTGGHLIDDTIIWLDDFGYVSEVGVTSSPSPVKFLTSNGLASQGPDQATEFLISSVGAYARPDAPDYLSLGASRVPGTPAGGSTLDFTWRSRNRAKGAIQLINDPTDSVASMTFDLYLYNITDGGSAIATELGIATENFSITMPLGHVGDTIEARVYANHSSLRSINYDWLRFQVEPTPTLLLEGDMQSGTTDQLLLEGDQQSGTDNLTLEGDQAL